MRIDRTDLELKFNIIMREISNDNKLLNEINDKMRKTKIPKGMQKILGSIPVEILTLKEIYDILKVVYNVSKLEISNPTLYFTEIETKEMEKMEYEDSAVEFPLEFSNVIKIKEDHYSLFLTAKELSKLYEGGLIRYNFETQRNKKIKTYKDKIIESININKTSVKEMTDLILKGEFITNHITINLLNDGSDDFNYNPETNQLIIKSGYLDIVDGFHRSLAIKKAFETNSDVDYLTGVYLTNFSVDKARKYIIQEDKKNKINKQFIKSLDSSDLVNQIIKKLNESAESDLQGKISTNYMNISNNISWVSWGLLSFSINNNFTIKTRKDVLDISEYLIEGFTYIIGSHPEEFIDRKDLSIRTYNNMYVGYITILGELYGKNDWKNKLKDILEDIDFSKDNKKWDELKITYKKGEISQTSMLKITRYFKGEIKNVTV